jgi:succinate dehydrogenase/fumarate reductase iron-sulfur protein
MSDVEARNRRDETRRSGKKVRVTIPRSNKESQSTFEVDRIESMTVLDLLLAIQRQHDPSLGFRYSCRVAMCNVCGLRVDGDTVLACRTSLGSDREDIRIEPLPGAPVLRDLVVETDQFVDEWAKDLGEWTQ